MSDEPDRSSPKPRKSAGPKIIAILVLAMLILHQDNWNWNDGTLVFGFIPIGLFYHACISVAATCVWFLATKIAWPHEFIEEVEAAVQKEKGGNA